MNASDYTPGLPLTTAAELAAWLAHEDAVFYNGKFAACTKLRLAMALTGIIEDDALAFWTIRQALVRCPQSAGEMREAAESGQVCAGRKGEAER